MTYLVIAYLVIVIVFVAFSVAGIYHLWRFGYAGDMTKPIIVVYSVLSLAIILLTFTMIFTQLL